MPRQMAWKPRLIHPSCATSISLASVSLAAEVLWWHMIPQCDDQGRLVGDIKTLKATCCPVRNEITIEILPDLLDELVKENLIIRYTNSAKPLIQITEWWSFQTPQWAYPSDFGAPPNWKDRQRYRKSGKVITKNWTTQKPIEESLDKPLGKDKGKA